jgi:amylosucrase
VYHFALHTSINDILRENNIDIAGRDNGFYTRIMANASAIRDLYDELYGQDPRVKAGFDGLIRTIVDAYVRRPVLLRQKDDEKLAQDSWFCSNQLVGMSLYVDRWCGGLDQLPATFGYLHGLGVNLLHLMPVFQSPPAESDGGYAVSDFRAVDPRYGSLQDLEHAQALMGEQGIYLMLDIVLNHTSRQHEWAEKARAGDARYQDYFYMFPDRAMPDAFEREMPEVFPESSPGNFTYVTECRKWVMTVFHHYQWDLNYRNPEVLVAMLDNIFFYANLGVDILRIDAPAFIWKIPGTTCQNLPEAHTLLRLIRQCVQVAAPGMALLGEAIVAPAAIMKYFGTGAYTARECDIAYNATQMALQWDALATGDTRVMLAAQRELLQKPLGTTWITYTRCHDDIGFGYEDYMIAEAGYQPAAHRKFLQEYYSGRYPGSDAMGALFSVHPVTQDARISGSLASLCGTEKAMLEKDVVKSGRAIDKILLMQAHALFIGGIPMLFYGDEAGYINDYSYLEDAGKSYDNRWMHRPVIDWEKNERTAVAGTVEGSIFSGTKRLIGIRKRLTVVSDRKNLTWLEPGSHSVAGYARRDRSIPEAGALCEGWQPSAAPPERSGPMGTPPERSLYCLFNFGPETAHVSWYVFRQLGPAPGRLYDHWGEKYYAVGADHEHLEIAPYGFLLLEVAG